MKRVWITVAVALALAGQAHAQAANPDLRTVGRWETEGSADRALDVIYLAGVAMGFTVSNGASSLQHAQPMFCQPPKLAMTGNQIGVILDQFLSAHPNTQTAMPIGVALYYAMRETFPCASAAG